MNEPALKLQAGSLTALFAGPIRRDAESSGAPPPSDEQIRQRVVEWRSWVSEGLEAQGHLRHPLAWPEVDVAPPVQVEVAPDAVRALKLLLVTVEHQSTPEELPESPERHPHWIEAAEAGFKDVPFAHVVVPEFWLPAGFSFTFPCPWPDGHELMTGSVEGLHDDLAAVIENLFTATPLDAALWSADPGDSRSTLTLAKHATAQLMSAAKSALDRRQPLAFG